MTRSVKAAPIPAANLQTPAQISSFSPNRNGKKYMLAEIAGGWASWLNLLRQRYTGPLTSGHSVWPLSQISRPTVLRC